jgi:hypothetical protein
MPLDVGIADILDRFGHGLPSERGLEVRFDHPDPADRLSAVLDMLADCMIPRALVFAVDDQPMCGAVGFNARLVDLNWYSTGLREGLVETPGQDPVEILANTLKFLTQRGDFVTILSQPDIGFHPSDAVGVAIEKVRIKSDEAGYLTPGALVVATRQALRLTRAGEITFDRAADVDGFGPHEDISSLTTLWDEMEKMTDAQIGSLQAITIGGATGDIVAVTQAQTPAQTQAQDALSVAVLSEVAAAAAMQEWALSDGTSNGRKST